jgi:hypothetical protein
VISNVQVTVSPPSSVASDVAAAPDAATPTVTTTITTPAKSRSRRGTHPTAQASETPTGEVSSASALTHEAEHEPEAQGEVQGDDASDTKHTLKPSNQWPPPIYVDSNISAQERYYIEHRWYTQWEWYDKRASDAKRRYHTLQVIIVVGSASVPVLVGLAPNVPAVIPILISLGVTIAAGLENVFKNGDSWRNFRQASEELQREKSMYDVKSGAYRKAKRPFLLFVQRCEDVIAKQNGNFLQLTEEQQPQQAQQQNADNEPAVAVKTEVTTAS